MQYAAQNAEAALLNPAQLQAKRVQLAYMFAAAALVFFFGGALFMALLSAFGKEPDPGMLDTMYPISAVVAAVPGIIGFCILRQIRGNDDTLREISKYRFAHSIGWIASVRKENRYAELRKHFPHFFTVHGRRPRVREQWWGAFTMHETVFPVWFAELCYDVGSAKNGTPQNWHVVGVRLPSNVLQSVTLMPETNREKLLHLFTGEHKTGNADFDAAFHIVSDTKGIAAPLLTVLTPPFIRACLQLREQSYANTAYVHRERDILLLRWQHINHSDEQVLYLEDPSHQDKHPEELQAAAAQLVAIASAFIQQADL